MAKATAAPRAPMRVKVSRGYRVFQVFNTILMILICCVMLYPFLYLIAQSFSSYEAIVAGKVGLLPVDFNLDRAGRLGPPVYRYRPHDRTARRGRRALQRVDIC